MLRILLVTISAIFGRDVYPLIPYLLSVFERFHCLCDLIPNPNTRDKYTHACAVIYRLSEVYCLLLPVALSSGVH